MNTFTPAPPSFLRVAMQLVLGLKQPARAFSSTAYVTSREDDPYKLLGLQQPTSVHVQLAAADIKTAFRKQALLLHPDVAKGTVSDPNAFVRLVAAYELLLDPKARAQYHERKFREQQQDRTAPSSTQGPAHHPDGHVHRQQRPGAQHTRAVSKHQHVSDAELQTWRYGVGHWLSATRARRAALAGGGGGQDDEGEGGIAATARMLLWKHRAELETDVGAALAHAFLGPRLALSAAQPLPVAFEMEQRQGPHAGPEVLHLVSGRTLLGVVTTQPPLSAAAQPGSHGQEQLGVPHQQQQQHIGSKMLHSSNALPAVQAGSEQGSGRRAVGGFTGGPGDNARTTDSTGAATSASLAQPAPHRQHGSLSTVGQASVQPQLPPSLSGWDPVGAEGRQLVGRYSRLRSAFGTGTFLTPDERKLLAKLQTEAAHREWQAGLHSVPAPGLERQGCSPVSPFAEGLTAGAGGRQDWHGGFLQGSISASASLGGRRLRHRLKEVEADGTQSKSVPQHLSSTSKRDSQCSPLSPSPAQGGSVKTQDEQDGADSSILQGSSHSSRRPYTRGTSASSIDDSSSTEAVQMGGSEHSPVYSSLQQPAFPEKQPSQDTNEISRSAARGQESSCAALPVATMRSSSISSGVLPDVEQRLAADSGDDASEDTGVPATWRFNTDSPGSVTLYLTLTVHSGQPVNTKSSSGASSAPSLWGGTTHTPVQPGQALHAWAVAEPRPAGQQEQPPRIKVYVQGKLLAGIVGDLVYAPLGHLCGHIVRGGSLGLHMIHAFVISHHGDARPMMRLGARIYRAQLPGSRWWLFPPRTPSHDIGGWYIEWEGYKRATHPGFMDPAVWIFACAFSTLEFERQLWKHTLPATRQASLLSGAILKDRWQALLPAHRAPFLSAGSTLGSSRDSSSGIGTAHNSKVMHSGSDASDGAFGMGTVRHPSITAASIQKEAAAFCMETSAQGAGGQKPEAMIGSEAELQQSVSGGQGTGSLQLLGSSALLECQSWVQGVCWPRLRHLMGFW